MLKSPEPQFDKLPDCIVKQRHTNKVYFTSNNATLAKETDKLIKDIISNKDQSNNNDKEFTANWKNLQNFD